MKHLLASFLTLAALPGCQVTPATSETSESSLDTKYIDTVISGSDSSVAGIMFSALKEFSETTEGGTLVMFGPRDEDATELSLIVGTDEIHCQRYIINAGLEYSCQMSESFNAESDSRTSLHAYFISAMTAFSEITDKTGYNSIYFLENDHDATEFSVSSTGEKLACSRYLINATESYSCNYSKR